MKQYERSVLYAEDDADDREFLEKAITAIDDKIELLFADNGLRALDTLERLKIRQELPCTIILDINMPHMDGKETLIKIQADPELNKLPVFIFTSGSNPNDKAYFAQHGIEMITKPSATEDFYRLAKHMIRACIR